MSDTGTARETCSSPAARCRPEPLPTHPLLGADADNVGKLRLREIISYTTSIVSRGTLCWAAEDSCGQPWVVKEAWRDATLKPEAHNWQVAKEKGVLG